MLSLKYARPQSTLRTAKALTDLPSEILDLIVQYIYQGSGSLVSSILAISRTCRHTRASTYPLLFEQFTIKANADVITKRSWEGLQNLAARPHLVKHIRCLRIQVAIENTEPPKHLDIRSARMGQAVSRRQLFACLNLMTGLRSLKLHYLSDIIFEVLEQLTMTSSLQISLDLSESELSFGETQTGKLQQIVAVVPGWTLSMALPRSRLVESQDQVAATMATTRPAAIDWCDNASTLRELVARNGKLSNLEEMHISSKILQAQEHLHTPGFIPWGTLKRLHVEGDRQTVLLLSSNIDGLFNLEDLRLHPCTVDAFHHDCVDPMRSSPQDKLSYTKLPSLRHLALNAICPHIHPYYFTTPNLRTLVIRLAEYDARLRNLTEARPPSEIRWIADNLPHLDHLELHIGPLENLWHPTAIPGVEVNVEVYLVLREIARIRQLQTLRLFPPYVPRNAGHDYLNARQPLSDEQAIRVFRHLHSQRPSLHTLSVTATFPTLRDFAPMSWLVRHHTAGGSSDSSDGRISLTTRQAGKHYEVEQTWVGQRRLSTKNRRHSYRRPYLVDLRGGWIFPVEDPPLLR